MARQVDNTVTKQGLLKKIVDLIGASQAEGFGTDYTEQRNRRISAHHEATQLKELLSYLPEDGAASSSSWSNPFGSGGSGGSGGAPQFSNADNRFAAGLSDAETRLRSLLDNPDNINQSAAYKFRVGQGQEALQRSLGARGLLNSGNRLTELTKYGQDMASQEYDNQYNRLGSLLGNYSQGYTADKNSNVNLYGHQANAWNKAQENQDRVNIANKEIWSKRTPVPIPGISNGFRWV